MSGTADKQKREFSEWAKDNLGEKVGIWYATYIEQFGTLLKKFNLDGGKDYYTNFFFYTSFDEFKDIYKQVIGQTDNEIAEIVKGKQLRYPEEYAQQKLEWNRQYAQILIATEICLSLKMVKEANLTIMEALLI